jgi:hypothetical protein
VTDLNTVCPYQEKDIVIPERDIQMAVRFKSKSGDKALVSCPLCCKVMEITGAPDDVQEWNPDMSKMVCVPFLEDTVLRIPAGTITEGEGEPKYRPGSGGDLLPKREYMFTYGIDPECYFAKKNKK